MPIDSRTTRVAPTSKRSITLSKFAGATVPGLSVGSRFTTMSGSATSPLGIGIASGASGQPTQTQPVSVRLTLDSYTIYQEDDGFGGAGIDLYVGFIANGGLPGEPVSAHGATAVRSGMQGPRSYRVNQELFTRTLHPGGDVGVLVNLIESDGSTSRIVDGYASLTTPDFGQAGNTYTDAEIAGMMFNIFAPIGVLIASSNTDDDYGRWTIRLSQVSGIVTCVSKGADRRTVAVNSQITVDRNKPGYFDLRYVDSQNDIDCKFLLEVL